MRRTRGSMSAPKRTISRGLISSADTGGRLFKKAKFPRPARAPALAEVVIKSRRFQLEDMERPLSRQAEKGNHFGVSSPAKEAGEDAPPGSPAFNWFLNISFFLQPRYTKNTRVPRVR